MPPEKQTPIGGAAGRPSRPPEGVPGLKYLFSGVRPSSGAAGLSAGETWQISCAFGVETLLLPRTAALRTLNRYLPRGEYLFSTHWLGQLRRGNGQKTADDHLRIAKLVLGRIGALYLANG